MRRSGDRTAARTQDVAVSLYLNGERHATTVPPWYTLLDLLRFGFGLRGTKESCREGACGACTVLLDGHPINACLMLAASAHGRSVTTIEGLTTVDRPHPLQEAFVESGAIQCGYCTPGMLVAASALLKARPMPTEDEIRRWLSGNLCRCTGYAKIVEAVRLASQRLISTTPER